MVSRGLNVQFPDNNEVEHFIIGLLAIWKSPFVMYLLKYFFNIFGTYMFFLLIGKSS